MIYFLYETYQPNTAHINRALAYFRSIEKMKIPIKVVFFLPDAYKSKIQEDFKYVDIKYCWDNWYINNKVLKYITYWFYVNRLLFMLKMGDKVYIYALNDIKSKFVGRKGVDVFFEQTECPDISLPGSWLHHPTMEEHINFCKRIKGLIVISHALKEYFIKKGVQPSKIHIVNMTVDETRFEGINKEPDKEKYIAYCGTVSNNKDGVDNLIKAFAIVTKKHKGIKLYIVGKAPGKKENNVNIKLINELGLHDKVVLTGMVKASEMPQLLVNAEVLALARPDNIQAKYGFPTKLGEYLLTGNPVVVTSVGDISMYLQDGFNAIIAKPDVPEIFAEKLLWALEHPIESKTIGARGKEVALKKFNAFIETVKLMNVVQCKNN